MQDMANDMRNRFLVALLFAIPVFLYSPMGKMFGDFATPFGMDRNLFLFIVATAMLFRQRDSVLDLWLLVAFSGWLGLATVLTWIIIAAFFLPIFTRLNIYSVYEFLGRRFDFKTRLLGVALL